MNRAALSTLVHIDGLPTHEIVTAGKTEAPLGRRYDGVLGVVATTRERAALLDQSFLRFSIPSTPTNNRERMEKQQQSPRITQHPFPVEKKDPLWKNSSAKAAFCRSDTGESRQSPRIVAEMLRPDKQHTPNSGILGAALPEGVATKRGFSSGGRAWYCTRRVPQD